MTRDNYFAFKKALKGFVCNITKKGDYITIEPDQRDQFRTMDVLPEYLKKAEIEYDVREYCYSDIIRTIYGDLKWVSGWHTNTQVYYARYKIVD